MESSEAALVPELPALDDIDIGVVWVPLPDELIESTADEKGMTLLVIDPDPFEPSVVADWDRLKPSAVDVKSWFVAILDDHDDCELRLTVVLVMEPVLDSMSILLLCKEGGVGFGRVLDTGDEIMLRLLALIALLFDDIDASVEIVIDPTDVKATPLLVFDKGDNEELDRIRDDMGEPGIWLVDCLRLGEVDKIDGVVDILRLLVMRLLVDFGVDDTAELSVVLEIMNVIDTECGLLVAVVDNVGELDLEFEDT